MSVEAGDVPIGADFLYNIYHPLLEGLILERVTGMHVAEYLQEKYWIPMVSGTGIKSCPPLNP